jgi:hypothetical protein
MYAVKRPDRQLRLQILVDRVLAPDRGRGQGAQHRERRSGATAKGQRGFRREVEEGAANSQVRGRFVSNDRHFSFGWAQVSGAVRTDSTSKAKALQRVACNRATVVASFLARLGRAAAIGSLHDDERTVENRVHKCAWNRQQSDRQSN